MNAKANPDFPGRENNELIAYVVVDCKASDSLVHEVVGYQEITKNELNTHESIHQVGLITFNRGI